MQKKISFSQIVEAIKAAVEKLDEEKRYLDRLDSPIGDGDHGRTVSNAFQKIVPLLEEGEANNDIGRLLRGIGRNLALSAGAAAGPLYGMAFMEAGKVVEGKTDVGLEELTKMLEAAKEGIKKRGKAEVGEKTMLDTIHPALESLKESLSKNLSLKDALQQMKKAAKEGMESTRNLISQKGRSSRLGERTIGHIDPGAASSYLIIEAVVDCLVNKLG